MKLLGHVLVLCFLLFSLKTIASERIIDQLGTGSIDVIINQEDGTVTVNSFQVDGDFLIEKKSYKKGGESSKRKIRMQVQGTKLCVDLDQVHNLTFASGNVLKVKELVKFILSGNATVSQDPTGTHGGGK